MPTTQTLSNIRIRHKIDTENNFVEKNYVLCKGEIGFALENGIVVGSKIGNGEDGWNNIDYYYDIRKKVFNYNEDTTIEFKHNDSIIFASSCNITLPYISDRFFFTIKNISDDDVAITPSETVIDDSSDAIVLKKNNFVSFIQFNNKTFVTGTDVINTQLLGELTMESVVHNV